MPFPMRSRPWAHLSFLVFLAAPVAGCGDSTGPDGPPDDRPGINIVAGADLTDTIDAVLPEALRVVVRDTAGRIMPGTVVRFSTVPIDHPAGGTASSVFMGGVNEADVSTFQVETTSAEGVALVRIVLGSAAGSGGVIIEVPEAGLRDTARFTIRPGAAARVVLPVADTAIQVGQTLALGGRVEDRYANPRAEVVRYETTGPGLTLTGGEVSASEPARAAVTAHLDGGTLAPATTWVSVVPDATVALLRGDRIATATLAGTGLTGIPHPLESSHPGIEWHPDGKSLFAVLGTFGGPASLYRVGLDGATELIVTPDTRKDGIFSVPGVIRGFTYSPHDDRMYLSGRKCNYNAILYRLPISNPTAMERLSPTGMDECFELVNHWPSLSPDGARLAFENQTGNQEGFSVRVMTVAARSIREIVPGGQHPRWSPTDDLIAYWAADQIWVVRSDGTGRRVVSPAGRAYVPGVRWSPDGTWIVARFHPIPGAGATTVALIDVSTGMEIPLPWTTHSVDGLPAWKPAP